MKTEFVVGSIVYICKGTTQFHTVSLVCGGPCHPPTFKKSSGALFSFESSLFIHLSTSLIF